MRHGRRFGGNGRPCAVDADPEDAHRTGDVLDLDLAHVLERDIELVAHLVARRARDADAPRHRQPLDSRRHVDAVAIDVVALDDDVAEVDADAEHQALVLGRVGLIRSNGFLNLHRAGDGVDHAGELDQGAVAHQLDDATAMAGNERIDDRAAQGLEAVERARLVDCHEAAVADHVRAQNRGEPASDIVPCHGCAPNPNKLLLAVYGTSTGESNGLVSDSPPSGPECPLRAYQPRRFSTRGTTGKGRIYHLGAKIPIFTGSACRLWR